MLIKLCVKLFSLPRGLLLPLMLPSCVIGAYAVRLSMLDIWIMFAAGALRYLLREFRFSLAPVVLGVILAPMADENLRRALYIFAEEPPGFVFTQYVGDVLLVVVALIFLEGALRLRRTRHATREEMA